MKDETTGMTTPNRWGSEAEPLITLSEPEDKRASWLVRIMATITYLVLAAPLAAYIYACIIMPPLWWGLVVVIVLSLFISLVHIIGSDSDTGPV